jgi:hypothetical protein
LIVPSEPVAPVKGVASAFQIMSPVRVIAAVSVKTRNVLVIVVSSGESPRVANPTLCNFRFMLHSTNAPAVMSEIGANRDNSIGFRDVC